jgi:hypothetical protein
MSQLVASDLKNKTKNFSNNRLPNRSLKILWEEKKHFEGKVCRQRLQYFKKNVAIFHPTL